MKRAIVAALLAAMACGRVPTSHTPPPQVPVRTFTISTPPEPPPQSKEPEFQHPLYIFPPPPKYDQPVRNPSPAPELISGEMPRYPDVARRARVAGVVIVELLIERDGRVGNVRVLKPLPFGLDQAAVDAVRTWRYKPVRLNGRPVPAIWKVAIPFNPSP